MTHYKIVEGNFLTADIKSIPEHLEETFKDWIEITEPPQQEVQDYLQVQTQKQILQSYETAVDTYIQDEVTAYNLASGYAFVDINAFAKYALLPDSIHYSTAMSFIAWADAVWTVARGIQQDVMLGNRDMPSIEDFLVELPRRA